MYRPHDLNARIADIQKARTDNQNSLARNKRDPLAEALVRDFDQIHEHLIAALEEIRSLREELGKVTGG